MNSPYSFRLPLPRIFGPVLPLSVLLASIAGSSALGASFNWRGESGSNFSDALNWEGSSSPSPADANDYSFLVEDGGTPFLNAVGSNSTWRFSSLTFGADAGAFVIQGGSETANRLQTVTGGSIISQNSSADQRIAATILLQTGSTRFTGNGAGALFVDSLRFAGSTTTTARFERSATIGTISSAMSGNGISQLLVANPAALTFSASTSGQLSIIDIATTAGAAGTTLQATHSGGFVSSAALRSNASFGFAGTQAMRFEGNLTMLGSVGNKTLDFSNTGGTTLSGEKIQLGAENGSASRSIIFRVADEASAVVSGTLTGDASTGKTAVIKSGEGVLTLTKDNDFNGGTTLQAGTLIISNASGSATGSGVLAVTGGTLGGTGVIAPDGEDISISGGRLVVGGLYDHPAEGISSLQIRKSGGNVAFSLGSGADIHLDIRDTLNYERLVFDVDTINLAGRLILDSTHNSWAEGDEFKLFDWGQGVVNGTFSVFLLPDLQGSLTWDTSDLYTTGALRVIPEAGAAHLLAFGLLSLVSGRFLLRRRKRWQPLAIGGLLSVASLNAQAEQAAFVYTFQEGTKTPQIADDNLIVTEISTGNKALVGVSKYTNSFYWLLAGKEGGKVRFLPQSKEEALTGDSYMSFAIAPQPGKSLNLGQFRFNVGGSVEKASLSEYNVHIFATVHVGGDTFEKAAALDQADSLRINTSHHNPIALTSTGVIDLSDLPRGIQQEVIVSIYAFFTQDGSAIEPPPGNRNVIRISQFSLLEE